MTLSTGIWILLKKGLLEVHKYSALNLLCQKVNLYCRPGGHLHKSSPKSSRIRGLLHYMLL